MSNMVLHNCEVALAICVTASLVRLPGRRNVRYGLAFFIIKTFKTFKKNILNSSSINLSTMKKTKEKGHTT